MMDYAAQVAVQIALDQMPPFSAHLRKIGFRFLPDVDLST
jgi:hypothetical protein